MEIILYCLSKRQILSKNKDSFIFSNNKKYIDDYNILNGKCVIKCKAQDFFRIIPCVDFNNFDDCIYVGERDFTEEKKILEKSLLTHRELDELISSQRTNGDYEVGFGLVISDIEILKEFKSLEDFPNDIIIKLSPIEIYQILVQNKTLIIKNYLPKKIIRYFDWKRMKHKPEKVQFVNRKYEELICPYCFKSLLKLTNGRTQEDFSLEECPRCNFKFEK